MLNNKKRIPANNALGRNPVNFLFKSATKVSFFILKNKLTGVL